MTVIILGVGAGFGQAIAKAFGKTGESVVLVARHAENLQTITEALVSQGVDASYQVADVTNYAQVQQLLATTPDVQTLVYNVGNTALDSPLTTAPKTLAATFATNVLGCVAACQSFAQQPGATTILITGGGAALHSSALTTSLSMTKAALRSYALALHQTLVKRGIYVGLMTIQGINGAGAAMAANKVAEAYVSAAQKRTSAEIFYPYGTPDAPSEFEQLMQHPEIVEKLLATHPEFKTYMKELQ